MNNFNSTKRNKGRRKIGVVLCVLLLTTSMAAMTGTSFRQSESTPESSNVEASQLQVPQDATDTLRYSFLFSMDDVSRNAPSSRSARSA